MAMTMKTEYSTGLDDEYFKRRMEYPLDSKPVLQDLDLQNVREKKFIARVASCSSDEGMH